MYLTSHFHCLTAGLYLENGDYPENSHAAFCSNKQRSFEPFMFWILLVCILKTEITPKIRMLRFVLINSVLLNLLCFGSCLLRVDDQKYRNTTLIAAILCSADCISDDTNEVGVQGKGIEVVMNQPLFCSSLSYRVHLAFSFVLSFKF